MVDMSKQQEYSSDVVVACLQPICYPTQWNMNALPYRAFFRTRYSAVSRLLDVCCGATVGQQWGNSGTSDAKKEDIPNEQRTNRTPQGLKAFAVTDQEALCEQTFRSEKLNL